MQAANTQILRETLLTRRIVLTRRSLRTHLLAPNESLVHFWSKLCWDRLPTDLRLTYSDEMEVLAATKADDLIFRIKLSQALSMYNTNLRTKCFKTWAIVVSFGLKLKRFLDRKLRK